MSYLEIKGLTKIYLNRRNKPRNIFDPVQHSGDNVVVLNDIHLNFELGEMVCILGPSGCGKSTMLKIIAGFEYPTCGEIKINGRKVNGPTSESIFVFQHNGLFPWMTVYENIAVGLRKKEKEFIRKQVKELIEMVDLEGFEHYLPHQLSGGMQRRAELVRALAVNPNLLIMDEPFSGLDFLTHMKLREELVNMHDFIKKTSIMVTHDIDDALIMGDRIVVMSGRPSTVKINKKLDFLRPRDFERDQNLSRLRSEIFLMLGVPYAV